MTKKGKIGHNKQATIDKCNNIGQYTGQYKGQWVRTMGKDNIMDCILFISPDFPPPQKKQKKPISLAFEKVFGV